MKYLTILCLLLSSCSARPSNEMEQMTHEVLKEKQGIEIKVFPIPKTNSKMRQE